MCVKNVAEGEVAGEGEGEGDEAALELAFCVKLISCQQAGGLPQSCADSLAQQLTQLRASPNAVCGQAADAVAKLDGCAANLSCPQLQDSAALQALCGVNDVNQLVNQCQTAGGEGEGGNPCPTEPFARPSMSGLSLVQVQGSLDASTSPACGTRLSVTLQILLQGDATLVTSGLSSFDGISVSPLVKIVVNDASDVVATACADDIPGGAVGVQLLVNDQTTNSVCGVVQ